MSHHFTRKVCFQDLNDYETDALFCADPETGIVWMVSCTLGTLQLTGAQVFRIMGNDFDRQIEAVQEWYSVDGWKGCEAAERGRAA